MTKIRKGAQYKVGFGGGSEEGNVIEIVSVFGNQVKYRTVHFEGSNQPPTFSSFALDSCFNSFLTPICKNNFGLKSSRQTLPLSSIHITSAFSDHLPDPRKITKCYEFFKANGEFNKDIVINMRNVLVDGYVAYLVAKMVGMENVSVLQTNSDTLDKPKKAKEPDFDWEAFKAGKIAVHCDTEEKAKAFLSKCESNGMQWYLGNKPTHHTNWETYQKSTAYNAYYNHRLQYSDIGGRFLTEHPLEVVEFPFPATSKPAPEKPAKAAPKYKVGDKVKVIGDGHTIFHYIELNSVADIISVYDYKVEVEGKSKCDGTTICQRVSLADIEPYSEPDPVSAEPDKQEVVKLYCVKECKPGQWLTKGNVYNVVNGRITFDDGYVDDYDDIPIFEKGTEIDSLCVPLVKRPAKVGEWVYVTHTDYGVDEWQPGDIAPVINTGISGRVFIAKDKESYPYGLCYYESEYLVLDGYQPEPEKPKYYSGKVVCVDNDGDAALTVGKVYQCENGVVRWDDGEPMKNRFESVQHMNDCFAKSVVTNAKFIELKQ